MSLIGEALKRARQEAAYQEAARDGRSWGPPPAYPAPPPRTWPLLAAGVAAGALLVAALGGGLYWMMGRSERQAEQVAAREDVEAREEVALQNAEPRPVEAPAAGQRMGAAVPPAQPPGGQDDADRRQARAEEPATARPAAPGVAELDAAARREAARRAAMAASAAPEPPARPRAEPSAPPASEPAAGRTAAPEPPASSTQPASGTTEPAPAAPPAPPAAPPQRPEAGAAQTYVGETTLPSGNKIELTGIAYSTDQPVALLNGRVMSPGEVIHGYVLARIETGRVELKGPDGTLYLVLR